jgi:hypothetical protein
MAEFCFMSSDGQEYFTGPTFGSALLSVGRSLKRFTEEQDGAHKLISHCRDLYDAAKELLKKPKFAGK